MPKPDAEQFARVLLWHIAGLRADLFQVQIELDLMRNGRPVPSKQVQKERNDKFRDSIYVESIKECGLDEKPPPSARF